MTDAALLDRIHELAELQLLNRWLHLTQIAALAFADNVECIVNSSSMQLHVVT